MVKPEVLAEELMRIPSTTGQEAAVTAFLAQRLASLGWQVTLQPVTAGRANLYAHRGAPVVVLSTHLDTVPPELPIARTDTILSGRGACDAKGIAAAMVAAADQLVQEGEDRVGLLFLVGEEDGSDGARMAHLIEPKGRFLINGEPTENQLVTAQKGALRAILRARGRAAHSGYPQLGDSAINHLLDTLERIRHIPLPQDDVLGQSTLNIGKIHGGAASNVIAPSAEAELMWRLVAPSAALREAVIAACGEGCEVTFTLEVPLLKAPALPGWPSTTVGYASDLPFLGDWGIGYQFGPGTIHVAHTDHESIAIAELHQGVAHYVHLTRALLAGASL